MPTVKEPKKQDDVSIQDLYKAVLGLTKKLDKIVDSNTTGSNSLKYIQEQKANTEAINKLTKKFESFARDGKVTNTKSEKKALDTENKRLAVEKKKQDIRLKEEKAKQQKELFELKKKRELELAKHDAEIHQREIKERYGNRYKDTTAYKVGADIAGQSSNAGSAIALSMLTGGLVNPVIAKTLGLDKLVTSTVKFAGRTIGNGMASIGSGAKKTAIGTLDAISGLGTGALDGLNQMRLGIGKAADEHIKTRRLKIVEGIKSESDNAAAKDKAENNPVVKNQKTILTWLKGRFGDAPQEVAKEEEKKQSIFGKLVDMFGGLGGIVKGLGFAALPMLIKNLFPDFVEKLNEKFTNFLTDKGLSESTAAGVSQLVKDALPGALFGLASGGGFRAAIIGAGLTMAGNYLKRKLDEFQGNAESETTPKTIGPIPSNYAEAAIAGAAIGSLTGFKGMMIGALVGIAGQGLWDLGNKLGEWAATAVNWLKEHPATAIGGSLLGIANLGNIKKAASALSIYMHKAVGSSKNLNSALSNFAKKIGTSALTFTKKLGTVTFGFLKTNISKLATAMSTGATKVTSGISKYIISHLPAIKTAMSGLVKSIGWLGAAFMAYDIGKMIGEWVGKKMNEKEEKEREKINKKAKSIKDMSKEELGAYNQWLHDTGKWEGYAQGYTTEKGLIWDSKKDFDYDRSLEQFRNAQEVNPEKYKVDLTNDPNSGGYGTLGQINSKNGMLHGRQVVGLKELSLSGSVVSSNSKPYIAEGNKKSLQNLDKILNEWGYEVVYTSAMGGHRTGTGHWKGNKIDLQLKKNGRPAHLTPAQLNVLRKAGYWGPGTGALGWEPVSGQVGGGHYDLYVANGSSSGTVLASAGSLRLDTQNMPTAAENQYVAMNSMNETAMASAEANANSSGGILDMLGNIGNSISSGFDSMSSGSNNDGISVNGGAIGGGMPNIAMNIPNTNGGAGSSTGNVYAFGDVAKTPILYTL